MISLLYLKKKAKSLGIINLHKFNKSNKNELIDLISNIESGNNIQHIHINKKKGEPCDNDLQCRTKKCSNNICITNPNKKQQNTLEFFKLKAKQLGIVNVGKFNKTNKNTLVNLIEKLEKGESISHVHLKKIKKNMPCVSNDQCTTQLCVDNKCIKNPNKKINYKPLLHTSANMKNDDLNTENCYNIKDLNLKQHQETVIKFMRDTTKKGLVVFHSVGSGKTITSILSAKCLLAKYPKKKIIILTPASVVKQFKNELNNLNVSQDVKNKINIYSHYMWLDRYIAKQETVNDDTVMIVDEIHNFRGEFKEKQKDGVQVIINKYARALFRALKRCFKIIMMTATPLENDITDILNYMAPLNRDPISNLPIPNSLTEEYKNKNKLKGRVENYENWLNNYVSCKFSYFKNSDTEFYPTVERKNILLPMSDVYYKKYMQIENNNVDDPNLKKKFKIETITYYELDKFLNGIRRGVNSLDIESPKIKWCVDFIRSENNKNKRVLVYSTWKEFGINLIKSHLTTLNIKHKTISGEISKNNRHEIIQDYNTGDFNVLLITSAGAEGLDLKQTRSVLLLEPFWHHSRIEQVIGRAVRYKSHIDLPIKDRNVTIYSLILQKPSDKHNDNLQSADDILLQKSDEKLEKIQGIRNAIIQTSIESSNCL